MSDMIACRIPAPPGPPPGPPGGPTEEPGPQRPDFNHNSTVLIIGSCAGVLVLAMVVAGGVYYMCVLLPHAPTPPNHWICC